MILKKANVKAVLVAKASELRVGSGAVEQAAKAAEQFLTELAGKAAERAVAKRRKTILEEDIIAMLGQPG